MTIQEYIELNKEKIEKMDTLVNEIFFHGMNRANSYHIEYHNFSRDVIPDDESITRIEKLDNELTELRREIINLHKEMVDYVENAEKEYYIEVKKEQKFMNNGLKTVIIVRVKEILKDDNYILKDIDYSDYYTKSDEVLEAINQFKEKYNLNKIKFDYFPPDKLLKGLKGLEIIK